jgi:hypothetical protein
LVVYGQQTLGGTGTYTGATMITGGTVFLSGNYSTSAFTINGGQLTGSGTTGNLTINAGGTVITGFRQPVRR